MTPQPKLIVLTNVLRNEVAEFGIILPSFDEIIGELRDNVIPASIVTHLEGITETARFAHRLFFHTGTVVPIDGDIEPRTVLIHHNHIAT